MAMPIQPTPILRGDDAIQFFKMVERDLKTPAKYVKTPKIENARKLVKEYKGYGKYDRLDS